MANDVSAIQPELWINMVQIPLYKRLVSLEVANTRFRDTLVNGDILHIPYFGDLSAQAYTPGTAITATDTEWDFDTLTVSTYKHVTFYTDNPQSLTLNVDQARELASEAGYQLANRIDSHVLAQITGTYGFTAADAADLIGGLAVQPITAGTAKIIDIFANARKLLRDRNVEENVPWCAVVTPKIGSYIEIKAANAGYNVADATLRNGYAGDFMGFEVYISNNLPTGKCSAIAPTGVSGVSTTNVTCGTIYFGQKKMIDLVLMKSPALEVRQISDKIGSNFITWTLYGSFLTTKNRPRGLNVPVSTGFY